MPLDPDPEFDAPDASTVLDFDQLHELSGYDLEFEQELLRLFLADALDHLTRLNLAVAQADFPQAAALAHHLRGASANVGAVAMEQAAAAIENSLKAAATRPVKPLLGQLQRSVAALQRYLGQSP